MIKAIINGCNGEMGQILARLIDSDKAIKVVAGIDRTPDKLCNTFPVYRDIFEFKENANIIIDFSNPYHLPGLLDYVLERNLAMVIGTTGLSIQDMKYIKEVSEKTAIFYSDNMSLGLYTMISIIKHITKALSPLFDIEIIEKYHNKKLDSPSHTAYMIVNEINETLGNCKEYVFGRYSKKELRSENEIGIHSIRGGTIAGEHTILFAGYEEILEIKHTAISKKAFALGAINAAKLIADKKCGLYSMEDLININIKK